VENIYSIELAANLFRKICAKFHQNRSSFVEDITKPFWYLFSGHCVMFHNQIVSSVMNHQILSS